MNKTKISNFIIQKQSLFTKNKILHVMRHLPFKIDDSIKFICRLLLILSGNKDSLEWTWIKVWTFITCRTFCLWYSMFYDTYNSSYENVKLVNSFMYNFSEFKHIIREISDTFYFISMQICHTINLYF